MPNWLAVVTLVVNLVILGLAIAYELIALKQEFRCWRAWQIAVVLTLTAGLSAMFLVNFSLLLGRLA